MVMLSSFELRFIGHVDLKMIYRFIVSKLNAADFQSHMKRLLGFRLHFAQKTNKICFRNFSLILILFRPEISETLDLGLGLENTHFPGLGLGLSLEYS